MGYMHIDNLYKNQDILMFRECYALEKVHGTSAHVSWGNGKIGFYAGGESYEKFKALFNEDNLSQKFQSLGHEKVVVYGEACGGKQQGMRLTYGDSLRFVVFDVKIGDTWLSVPDMVQAAEGLGFEVVPWEKTSTSIEALDSIRDRFSEVAERWGCGPSRHREGIVLRPLIEVIKSNGNRIIAKHKGRAFSETSSPRNVGDPTKLKVLSEAITVAHEWVTDMRLTHVLDKIQGVIGIERTPEVISAMVEDVYREGAGEIIESDAVRREIGKRTANMFKIRLQESLH